MRLRLQECETKTIKLSNVDVTGRIDETSQEKKRPPGRYTRTQEDNIKMYLKGKGIRWYTLE
jgi:hypothetical protein